MACPIAWCAFTWEAFATLATGLSAVLAAYRVGKMQVEIQRRQTDIQNQALRLSLFERRYKIYEATEAFLIDVFSSNTNFDRDVQREFIRQKRESIFLFDGALENDLDEIYQEVQKFWILKREMYDLFEKEGHYGAGNPEKKAEIQNWISERLGSLPELFHAMRFPQ